MSAAPILDLRNLTKSFGGLCVVRDMSLTVRAGERVALIGPNGAGKTTVFNLISGVYPVDGGSIAVDGSDITHLPSRRRIYRGIARNFQNVRLMPHLTVIENLMMGHHPRLSSGWQWLVPFRVWPRHPWKQEALSALEDAGVAAYAYESVGALPFGIRKRVDLVRATMARPKLLLLDEPAAGLNPSETAALRRHLEQIARSGVTLLIVEHDMHFVGRLCDRVVVINFGEKIAEGSMAEVRRDPLVREAYLGTADVAGEVSRSGNAVA